MPYHGIIIIIVPELGLPYSLTWLAWFCHLYLLLQITVLINFAGKKHWAKQGCQSSCKLPGVVKSEVFE